MRFAGWVAQRGGRTLGLLHLKVIDHRLYAFHGGCIAGRSGPFAIVADLAAERDHAIGGLHLDLTTLDGRIAVKLALYLNRDLGVGAALVSGSTQPKRRAPYASVKMAYRDALVLMIANRS